MEAYGLDATGTKAQRVDRLWSKVRPQPNVSPTGNEKTAKVNLHRLKQTFFHLFLMWDGETQGWEAGRNVRRMVIDYARSALAKKVLDADEARDDAMIAATMRDICDDVALEWANGQSSFFFGFWRFFDIELRSAVLPFEKHAQGDMSELLNGFELIALQICAADKPMIRKVVLILLHFLLHYRDKHPDIIEFMCQNAAALDEEYIEFLNALLGRFVKARQQLDIKAYIKTSGLIHALHLLEQRLDEAALSGRSLGTQRATEATEHTRLRTIYATQTYVKTNEKVADFIFDLAKRSIDGDDALDRSWPAHDRLAEAEEKMPRFVAELESWLRTVRRVEEVDEPLPSVNTKPTLEYPDYLLLCHNPTARHERFSQEQHLLFQRHLLTLEPPPPPSFSLVKSKAAILKNYVKKSPAATILSKLSDDEKRNRELFYEQHFKFPNVDGKTRVDDIATKIANKVKEQWDDFLRVRQLE